MAKTFVYRAKDRTGQLIEGTLVADSQMTVANFVRNQGYYVTQVKEQGFQFNLEALMALGPVKIKDLAVFCRQFATMMDAGLSMIACLNILIDQTYNPRLKKSLKEVCKKVQEGQSLSKSMEEETGVFPTIMISMINAGEVGGVLDIVMDRLAIHFEKEHKLNEKVKSAMTYPAVVIVMAIMSITFILTFVFPTFVRMFDNMQVELPLPTRILLGISGFLRDYWLLLIPLIIASVYGASLVYKKPEYKKIIDPVLIRLPIFGTLWRKIAIARFSRMLSTLIRGGVPIITALDVVKKTADNTQLIAALSNAQDSIKEGLGLAAPLGASIVFTPMVVQMVSVGEETGELDKMLEKVADFYESDVDDMVSRLSTLLEPILIGVLGVIIGLMIISIVLPLFDIVTNFNKAV